MAPASVMWPQVYQRRGERVFVPNQPCETIVAARLSPTLPALFSGVFQIYIDIIPGNGKFSNKEEAEEFCLENELNMSEKEKLQTKDGLYFNFGHSEMVHFNTTRDWTIFFNAENMLAV